MNRSTFLRPLTGAVLFCGLCLSAAAPLRANDPDAGIELAKAVKAIADAVSKVCDPGPIVVGNFANDHDLKQTGGPEIKRMLIEELKSKGFTPTLSGAISITGGFEFLNARQPLGDEAGTVREIPAGRISFQIKERSGRVLLDSTKDVDGVKLLFTKRDDVAKVGGPNVFIDPSKSVQENDEAFRTSLVKPDDGPAPLPSVRIEGTKVRMAGAPWAVEILVATPPGEGQPAPHASYRPQPIEMFDGTPFVHLKAGQVYAVRIHNADDHELAAAVTIDGLSMYAFSEIGGTYVVLRPKTAGDVLGWHRNDKRSDSFLVAPRLPGDNGPLVANLDAVGSVTIAFHQAWERDADKPKDEPATRAASLRTTPGAPIDVPYERVKRHIGVFRGSITIRYDR